MSFPRINTCLDDSDTGTVITVKYVFRRRKYTTYSIYTFLGMFGSPYHTVNVIDVVGGLGEATEKFANPLPSVVRISDIFLAC